MGDLDALLQGAGTAEGVIGGVQLTMLEYRKALPSASKLGTFGKFSSAYRPLGAFRRVLGPIGNAGTLFSGIQDYNSMQNGEISAGRFAWRTGGGLASIGASAYIGGQFGGPWGAVAGTGVGAGVVAGEMGYDGFMHWHSETSKGLGNIEKALQGGWMPRW